MQKQTKQPPDSILINEDVKTCLYQLHDKYVFAPADKAVNNVIIMCKQFTVLQRNCQFCEQKD